VTGAKREIGHEMLQSGVRAEQIDGRCLAPISCKASRRETKATWSTLKTVDTDVRTARREARR
jgi:hypothetical protein